MRVVGAGQTGQSGNPGDAIAGWVPQLNGTLIDSTGKPVSVSGNNVLQQAFANNMNGQLLAQGQQIVATPGPNGQLTYSVMPSYQTVNIDGQEAFIIPSSGVNTQSSAAAVPQAQQALITPTGQIIRAQGVAASGAGGQLAQANMLQNVAQNVAGFGGLGNIVNIGGNLVNVGGMSGGTVRQGNNLMQAFQLPGFQALQQMQTLIQVPVSINGQSVMQTIQVPTPNIPIQSAMQQVGLNNNGIVTLGANAQSLQTLMASQQTQGQLAQQQVIASGDDGQIKTVADKGGQSQQQLNAAGTQAQASKVANMALTPSSSTNNNNSNAVQTLNVINTPQGQVILSSPTAPQQTTSHSHAQSLPTLNVPSYPQTITANAALSSTTTTTTSSTQSAAVLQSVLAQQQQQLLQGLANGQNLQLTNQGQLNWLQVSQAFLFFFKHFL